MTGNIGNGELSLVKQQNILVVSFIKTVYSNLLIHFRFDLSASYIPLPMHPSHFFSRLCLPGLC